MSPTCAAFVVFMPVMTYPTWPVHRRPVDTGSGARTPICSRAAVLSATLRRHFCLWEDLWQNSEAQYAPKLVYGVD